MKNKSLLPVLLLAAFALGACNLGGQSSQESKEQEQPASSEVQPTTSEDTTQYGVQIANKTALLEEWYAGANRDLEITLTPAGNALQELGKKNLVVSSSNEEVVKVNGLSLAALKEGTAKITVTYHGANDEIDLTILDKKPAPQKVNATPSQVMAADDSIGKVIYHVEGYVINWGTKTEWTQYGEMTVGDTADATEGMYVYGSYVEGVTFTWDGIEKYSIAYTNRDVLTNDLTKNLHIGDKVTMDVIRADYGTTKEVKGQILAVEKGAFVEATGVKIQLGNKDAAELSLRAKENKLLKAVIEPDNASEDAVWSSSDPTVATVANGFVKALKAGTTTIKAKVNATVEAELALTVTEALTIVHAGTQADPYTVDEAVAVVGGYDNQAMSEADIFVKGVVLTSSWSTKYSNYTIWMADSQDAKAFEIYAGVFADAAGITSEQATAFQKDNGLKGYEILVSGRAKFFDNTLELTNYKPNPSESTYVYPQMLSATKATAALTGVTLNQATAEVSVDDTVELTVSPKPFYAEVAGLTWESSDTSIATVANGVVTGVAAGTATIKVLLNEQLQGECVVTVKEIVPNPDVTTFTLTPANLLGFAGENVAYTADAKRVYLEGYKFVAAGCGAYKNASAAAGSDGIQMRTNSSTGTSKIYNGTAFEKGIKELVLNWAASKDVSNKDYHLFVEFSNVADFSTLVGTKINAKFTAKELKVTPTASAKYFRITHANMGAVYLDSIVVNLNDGSAQPEIAQPTGAFRGLAKSKAGTFLPVDMVLAADSVTLSANGDAVAVTSYEWDKTEGQISIVTDAAGYGTIVAKLDVENNAFTITSLDGTAALASLDLTYAVKLTGGCQFLDCEGSTAELQAMFLRRKMGSSGWEAANADDKIFSSENGKNGKGLSVKCWADGKIALTLKNDLNIPAKNIKSVGCWIYNPSATAYSTNLYFYPSAGNKDGKMVKTFSLPAGQWTFCECGVAGGSFGDTNTFYNFQFYTENVNTTLVFDNFCIYM